jgi:glycosyltransferase involved in cell wall biosynthesis
MPIPSLSIVIPVYNSEQSLERLLSSLDAILETLAEEYEVILVNDASRDNSGRIIDAATRTYPWLRAVHFGRNYGQHNAVLCGIRLAVHEVIVTMDDDLQHPPEEIPKLLAQLGENHDVVYGFPEKESHGWLRDLASRITKIGLQRAMGVHAASRISSFRAFRTELREAFEGYRGAFVCIDVLLSWGTTRFAAVPVRNPPRPLGTSNYTAQKLVRHAMNMITGFTTIPLQIGTFVGFGFALFGFLILGYTLARYFIQGASVPGFTFLASIIAIFSGTQLFALGIVGAYLSRMYFRSMDQPSYTVRHSTGQDTSQPQFAATGSSARLLRVMSAPKDR